MNGLGDVAFGGLVVADDRYRVFIAPQGSTPTDPLTTEQGVGTATDEFVVDDVEINGARQVAYTVSRLVGGDVETTIRRSTGTTTVDFDTASTADTFSGPFISVGRPAMNASGRVVHVGNDGASFVSSLAEHVGPDVVTGLSSLGLRPRLADDGTTVTDIAVERRCTEHPERTCSAPEAAADQFFDTAIVAGDGVQALASFTIAEQRIDGWGGLSDPDISPSGDAIVFTGERNGLVGTFLALRDPATGWQEPLAIAGPAAGTSAIADVEGSRPNVTQVSRGAAGPVDDLFVVVMVGRASPTGALGAHALRLIVDATPDPAVPFAVSIEGSDPVIEVGDDVLGSTVDSVVLADSVAAATAPTHVFDHWVAVHVRLADGRNAIVRARSLAPPIPPVVALSAPVAAPQGFRAAGLSSPVSPAAALLAAPVAPALLAADLVVLPGPHVAAVTVDDDTPTARVPTRVTNRSRTLDGTAASAVLDETGGGALKVLANPLLLGPDESTTLELPDTGTPNFAIGAPVTAGGDANDVSFSFAVEKGANRPPTGSLTGAPYTILDGEGLSLPVVTADPDGDSRSVTWDLDADGAYDDGTFSLNLTGTQVAALICGGSCVLDTPYPIAARVLDARGLDTILTSTVTITSPGVDRPPGATHPRQDQPGPVRHRVRRPLRQHRESFRTRLDHHREPARGLVDEPVEHDHDRHGRLRADQRPCRRGRRVVHVRHRRPARRRGMASAGHGRHAVRSDPTLHHADRRDHRRRLRHADQWRDGHDDVRSSPHRPHRGRRQIPDGLPGPRPRAVARFRARTHLELAGVGRGLRRARPCRHSPSSATGRPN